MRDDPSPRRPPLTVRLFLTLLVLVSCVPLPSAAAAVGDRVELRATHHAGVPLHREPRGTHDFQRVPDGTIATVMGLAQEGRWLTIQRDGGRTS